MVKIFSLKSSCRLQPHTPTVSVSHGVAVARGTSSALLQLTSALLNRTANQPGGVSLSQRPIGQQFLGTSETVASTACCVTPWRIRWQWLIHCQARAQWCVNEWVQLEGRWAVPHSVSGTSLSASMNGSACAVGQNIKDLVRAIMIMTMSLLACCYDCEHRIATASSHAPPQAQDYPGIVERWFRMQIAQGVTLVSRSSCSLGLLNALRHGDASVTPVDGLSCSAPGPGAPGASRSQCTRCQLAFVSFVRFCPDGS